MLLLLNNFHNKQYRWFYVLIMHSVTLGRSDWFIIKEKKLILVYEIQCVQVSTLTFFSCII